MFKQCKDFILLSASQPLKKNIGGHKVLLVFLSLPSERMIRRYSLSPVISSWSEPRWYYISDLTGSNYSAFIQCYQRTPTRNSFFQVVPGISDITSRNYTSTTLLHKNRLNLSTVLKSKTEYGSQGILISIRLATWLIWKYSEYGFSYLSA